jgi:hypothetical protein
MEKFLRKRSSLRLRKVYFMDEDEVREKYRTMSDDELAQERVELVVGLLEHGTTAISQVGSKMGYVIVRVALALRYAERFDIANEVFTSRKMSNSEI